TDQEEVVVLHPVPFTIGRRPGCSVQLNLKTISGRHAELTTRENQLWVDDLSSTNGTYVNGQRIAQPTELHPGDLLQFADVAFRVRHDQQNGTVATMHEDMCDNALALVQFDRLMEKHLVTPFFQPIIELDGEKTFGYEILARSRLLGLESCAAMFDAAARLNMEVELSRMLRWEGVREGLQLMGRPKLFVNTHPLEIRKQGLVESLAKVRQLSQDVPLVLEIHEAAITDPSEMLILQQQLADLGVGLAYDDFGAGQTRLTELIEAPPDYLKFDISLIHEIDRGTPERQRTLESLVKVALDLGVNPLAEGVETAGEAEVCRQLGFLSAQGFHFGRPTPLRSVRD
ncbi:MAG: EAL domain-containing protein, partial [bacterium]|nr:EAL domain-containing protein [bacterium]